MFGNYLLSAFFRREALALPHLSCRRKKAFAALLEPLKKFRNESHTLTHLLVVLVEEGSIIPM